MMCLAGYHNALIEFASTDSQHYLVQVATPAGACMTQDLWRCVGDGNWPQAEGQLLAAGPLQPHH